MSDKRCNLTCFKLTSSGNDFLLVQQPRARKLERRLIRRVCDRRLGIGADGLLVFRQTRPKAFDYRLFNADGSEAPFCGNALLCLTRLAQVRYGYALIEINSEAVQDLSGRANGPRTRIAFSVRARPRGVRDIRPQKGERDFWLVPVGVPHLVVRVDSIDRVDVVKRGRSLRHASPLGRSGANVQFVETEPQGKDGSYRIRTYERGVEDETYACGSGAAASAIVLTELSRRETNRMRFEAKLGARLEIALARPSSGAVRMVLAGKIDFVGTVDVSDWWR